MRKCSFSAKIDSSPVFVRRSSPSTPMMSPRSKHSASSQSVADLRLADEQLNLAGQVADVDELQLARVALQHDPAGGADLRADHFARALLGQPGAKRGALLLGVERRQRDRRRRRPCGRRSRGAGADVADRLPIVEPPAPRVVAQLDDPRQLLPRRAASRYERSPDSRVVAAILRRVGRSVIAGRRLACGGWEGLRGATGRCAVH